MGQGTTSTCRGRRLPFGFTMTAALGLVLPLGLSGSSRAAAAAHRAVPPSRPNLAARSGGRVRLLVGVGILAAVCVVELATAGVAQAMSGLVAVSAASGSDVWAVGDRFDPQQETIPTALHWDGSSWTVTTPTAPALGLGYGVSGVAIISPTDVWTVGAQQADPFTGGSLTLVEQWDGSGWNIIPSPNPTSDIPNAELFGVSADSANDIWAVGSYTNSQGVSQTLVEHWNGSAWTIVPSPDPATTTDADLGSVAAISPTDVWAVGGSEHDAQPLVEHWDGNSWSIVSTAAPTDSVLSSVSAVSADDVWAVGEVCPGCGAGGPRTLVEHWDGTRWSVIPSPNPGDILNDLFNISAITHDDAWAVGDSGASAPSCGSCEISSPLFEHWDGSSWQVVASPPIPGERSEGSYGAITADASDDVYAVGNWTPDFSDLPDQPLIAHFDGSSWKVVVPVQPTITQITPQSGPTSGGTEVTVTGQNFVQGAQVSFGGVAATSTTFNSTTSMTATSPPHAAGTIDITVTNPGIVASNPVAADRFTYTGGTTLTLDRLTSPVVFQPTAVTGSRFFTFTDSADEDPNSFGGTIDWGDGSGSSGAGEQVTIASQDANGNTVYAVQGEHAYDHSGTYTITVTVQSAGGGVLTEQFHPVFAPSLPTNLSESHRDGSAMGTWQPPSDNGGSPVTGYVLTATPSYTDRLPAPNLSPVSSTPPGGASARTGTVSGLFQDCHQAYTLSVSAQNANGVGAPATSDMFRPSGIVTPRVDPPYVVVLVDGIASHEPGFTFNPYRPTVSVPSYCPESFSTDPFSPQTFDTEGEADFFPAPAGPFSFFHKWNFGEIDSNGNPTGDMKSTPRALPGNPDGLSPDGTVFTHSFLLDAVAGQGSIILPFSYKGFNFNVTKTSPSLQFLAYSACQSFPGCGPSIKSDQNLLNSEIHALAGLWPSSKIIVVGHSQGGLVAFEWWLNHKPPKHFVDGVSLDSPINGVCVTVACANALTYPPWSLRSALDPGYIAQDAARGESFRFVGTYGDPVPFQGIHLYGTGGETVEHQLVFNYNNVSSDQIQSLCTQDIPNNCPIVSPPDHLSECPIRSDAPQWEIDAGHFVEKYCPLDVAYFNSLLHLTY